MGAWRDSARSPVSLLAVGCEQRGVGGGGGSADVAYVVIADEEADLAVVRARAERSVSASVEGLLSLPPNSPWSRGRVLGKARWTAELRSLCAAELANSAWWDRSLAG